VQDWGFQARRTNKWKNEIAYLTKLPPSLGLGRADFSASLYANLVGLEAPPLARTLELKPYVIGDVTTDNNATPKRSNDLHADAGVDAKYSITQNLTADLSYNTDFAQVEADEQQVNLTRFSLFFPEKRDFFLENQGLFTFGNNTFGTSQTSSDVPVLFYSRRIGLANSREVPILGGGRVTGRMGRYSLGVVDMQTRTDATAKAQATNFSVVRVKRDILRKSSIGFLGTARSKAQTLPGSNQVYGVDGSFGFYSNLTFAAFLARTKSDTVTSDDMSYRAQMDYTGDRYGVQIERLSIDKNFNPEVGFLRRADMRKEYAQLRFSPRIRNKKYSRIRKLSNIGQFTYIEDSAGHLSTRISDGEFAIEFQNSDRFAVGINDDYELLLKPFTIVPGAVVPAGGYDFTTGRIGYKMGQQRRLSGSVLLEKGSFYNGNRTTLTFNAARINASARLSLEPNISINRISLPAGRVTSSLLGSRITYTLTPLLFASALVQYNSSLHTVSTNARLRWEYRPGSEFFVVYNDEHNTDVAMGLPSLQNRALIVKVNRFMRF